MIEAAAALRSNKFSTAGRLWEANVSIMVAASQCIVVVHPSNLAVPLLSTFVEINLRS